MKKITKKVILNTTKDSLNDIVDQLQIDPNKKTKRIVEKVATRFFVLMKNEISKQTKKKLKAAKSFIKSKKGKKIMPVQ